MKSSPIKMADESFSGFSEAFQAAAAPKKEKVKVAVFNDKLEQLWDDKLEGAAAFLDKIAVSKSRSLMDGKKLLNPGAPYTICCLLCPWACGCTTQMPVQGPSYIEIGGTEAKVLVVCGAGTSACMKCHFCMNCVANKPHSHNVHLWNTHLYL